LTGSRSHARAWEPGATCQNLCGNPLVSIAEDYSKQDPERIWQESFSKIYDDDNFNKDSKTMLVNLSVLPGEIGMEVIDKVARIADWSKAVKDLVAVSFWEKSRSDRYIVSSLVRNFALQKLGNQREKTEKQIAHIIINLAQEMSDRIQPGKCSPDEMREGLDWFDTEWLNLIACASYAEQNDLCSFSDSVLQFMIRRGRLKDCEELYKKVLRVRKDSGDRRGEAKTWNDLGVCKQYQGQWDDAILHLKESIKLQESLLTGDPNLPGVDQLPKTYNSLGYVYQKKGDFEEAEKAYQQSLKICEEMKLKNLPDETHKEIILESSQTYSNLGLLRTYRGEQQPETAKDDFRNAERDFEKSLRIKSDYNDPRLGQTHNRLGYLYQLMDNKLPLAKSQFEEALSSLKEVNDKYELGTCYKGLGAVAQQQGNLEEAEKHFLNSLQSMQGQYYFIEEGEVHIKLAEVYKALKKLPEALAKAQKAMNILEHIEEESLKNKARKLRDDISKQM